MSRRFAGPLLVLLALVSACVLFAQRDLATLVGTVTVPSGGVIANATITVTENDTNEIYTLTPLRPDPLSPRQSSRHGHPVRQSVI